MKPLKETLKKLLGKDDSVWAGAGLLDPRIVEGRQLLEDGKAVQALRLAQAELDSGRKGRNLHLLLGLSLDRTGRNKEALEAYKRELESFPDNLAAKQQYEKRLKTLTPPEIVSVPTLERSYHSSLPGTLLQEIQRRLHNYTYRGVPMLKNPFDFAIYPLLLWNLKPRTIIEIGSKSGGSALWFGDLLNSFGVDGHIVSVDIVRVEDVSHPRVTFLQGDGRNLNAVFPAAHLESLPRPWLVIEDADHEYETSIAVLRFFDKWLRSEDFIVVEDGIISDLTSDSDCNSGPHRALKEFLAERSSEYVIEAKYCDLFGYNATWCSNGFLRKTIVQPA